MILGSTISVLPHLKGEFDSIDLAVQWCYLSVKGNGNSFHSLGLCMRTAKAEFATSSVLQGCSFHFFLSIVTAMVKEIALSTFENGDIHISLDRKLFDSEFADHVVLIIGDPNKLQVFIDSLNDNALCTFEV